MVAAMRQRSRLLGAAVGLVSTALLVSGCAGGAARGGTGDSSGGDGVPFGASVSEWQKAFEEIEPMDIVFQSANSATAPSSQDQIKFLKERIEEYSGGKISVEAVFGDAIAPNVEADEALADGRIDIHLLVPFLQPSDFPVSGGFALETSSARDSPVVSGTFASMGAINEALWQESALLDEYENVGLNVIAPMVHTGNAVLACAEPLTTLEDLKGKQIRVGPQAQFGQIEALGATPVAVAFADLFESLQRGIVDCMTIGLTTMVGIPGMIDLVPYIIAPVGTAFAVTPGIQVAGSNWADWPLPVQQLVFDSFAVADTASVERFVGADAKAMHEQAIAAGGAFLKLDDEASDSLRKHNEKMASEWADSNLVDGKAFVTNLEKAYKKWDGLMAEAGYSDAELPDFEEWYDEDADFSAFEDAYFENVTIPNRPS